MWYLIFVLFLTQIFTGQKYSFEVYKEFPSDWFEGLNIKTQITSSLYRNEVYIQSQMWRKLGNVGIIRLDS